MIRIALIVAGLAGAVLAVPLLASDDAGVRYHTILLLEITDAEKYATYHDRAVPFINKAGCEIDRELDITKPPRGTLDIGQPNRIVSMYCDAPNALTSLGENEGYRAIVPLRKASLKAAPIIIRGKNVFVGRSSMSPLADRLYVVKLTKFKPDQAFHGELARIDAELEPLGFHREKMIYVDSVRGMDAPSTIGFMFYDDPSQQKTLYDNEQLVGAIGAFNATYADGFVYLEGVARP